MKEPREIERERGECRKDERGGRQRRRETENEKRKRQREKDRERKKEKKRSWLVS